MTEPKFSFETDAGTRGNIKHCALAGPDQRLAKRFFSRRVMQPLDRCPERHRMVILGDISC